jgi:hypothetical protein
MSRIADAYERTGRRLPGDTRRWDAEREPVTRHMGEVTAQIPNPNFQRSGREVETQPVARPEAAKPIRVPQAGTIDFELASAIRRIFLAPESIVRSVLFCTPPGDPRTDVAWSVAELLASQSGKPVALVADGSTMPAAANGTHALVTCIGWYEPVPHAATETGEARSSEVLGKRVSTLDPSFDYVIVSATAQRLEDLPPLATEVDGVVVVLSAGETRKDVAAQLVGTLHGANLLGVILATSD